MMTSTKFSLKTLEDIFKINWILFINTQFVFIIYFFLFFVVKQVDLTYKNELFISFVILIVFFLTFRWLKLFNKNITFIFLFFYFFIFLFFYFFIPTQDDKGKSGNSHSSLIEVFLTLFYFFFALIHPFISIPVFSILYSNIFKSLKISKKEVFDKIFFLFLSGFIYVVSLNLVYFCSEGIFIMGVIILFYFILYKYMIKNILAHFEWFLVVNCVLIFLPFLILYVSNRDFFTHQILLVSDYCGLSTHFSENFIDKLNLLSPYQTIVFPLFFNFNAYIIAQKIIETKYPTFDQEKGFESKVRPEFKTEQQRKDWYDQNY